MPIDPQVKQELLDEIRQLLRDQAGERLKANRSAVPSGNSAEEEGGDEGGEGEEVSRETPVADAESNPSAATVCSMCGEPIEAGDSECPICGEPVPGEAAEFTPKPRGIRPTKSARMASEEEG